MTGAQYFCSFDIDGADYSDISDGYGNLPGTIYLGDQLRQGANNKVRITTWGQRTLQ